MGILKNLYYGDIIITKDSETKGDIAVSALVREELTNIICGYHLAIIRPLQNNRLSGEYLNKLFNAQIMFTDLGPIMLVYEIEDTEGPELPEDLLNPFKVKGKFDPDDFEYLVYESLKDGILIRGASLRGFLADRAFRIGKEKKQRCLLH